MHVLLVHPLTSLCTHCVLNPRAHFILTLNCPYSLCILGELHRAFCIVSVLSVLHVLYEHSLTFLDTHRTAPYSLHSLSVPSGLYLYPRHHAHTSQHRNVRIWSAALALPATASSSMLSAALVMTASKRARRPSESIGAADVLWGEAASVLSTLVAVLLVVVVPLVAGEAAPSITRRPLASSPEWRTKSAGRRCAYGPAVPTALGSAPASRRS